MNMQITARSQPTPSRPLSQRLGFRLVAAVAIGAVLLGVFTMYAHPDFLVSMADQLWSCF